MIDVQSVLGLLAKQRPLFHSEADFQHAVAWLFHQQLPAASVRLEFPFHIHSSTLHVDIWVEQNNSVLAMELKYKTHTLSLSVNGEQFAVKNHGAQNINRCAFIEDIQRLEQIIAARTDVVGYAIFLTNEVGYWTAHEERNQTDSDFRLNEGRTLHGTLAWKQTASAGTVAGHEEPITLRGQHVVHWKDYSDLSARRIQNGRFRYLAIKISS